ncbi:MAG: glycosyltransferase family 4 protein [Chlorobiaceae bacterium]|nr:glycosyltransferase family 4 protein [Chlorobiaceae bacterium]
MKKLRIAQIAPLIESVPPLKYGGTERVVYYLTEGLVKSGHEVTLFASGDSVTSARLVAPVSESLRLGSKAHSTIFMHMLMLSKVYEEMAGQFDIIHSHLEYLTLPYAVRSRIPTIMTMHGRLDVPDYADILKRYSALDYVSISDSQRAPAPALNWAGTVYHGYPENLFSYNPDPERYFLFLGRFSEEKRPDQAIMLARECKIHLKLAAKIDPADRLYFKEYVEPLLDSPYIEYVGEVDDIRKSELLRNACGLLNPIDWPEPFGLVMIEALACGTPVIVRRCGSASEVITHGVSGFVCDNRQDFINAIQNIDTISRAACRREFEQRFTLEHMTEKYERLYRNIISSAYARHPASQAFAVNGAAVAV